MPQRRRRSPEITRPSIFWFFYAIVSPLVSLFAKIRIEQPEKLPMSGAYVLAPNHASEFDPLIVSVGVFRTGRAPRFMAKESLFRTPVVGWVLRATGMVPVARAGGAAGAKQTMAAARTLADNGRGVIVYPEGTLTRDPNLWPMRGKSGAVRLAIAAQAPLIPVAHWGAQEIMPRYGKFRITALRRPVTLRYGDPVDLSEFFGREQDATALNEATDRVMAAIAELLSELRGEAAPATRWNPAKDEPKRTDAGQGTDES